MAYPDVWAYVERYIGHVKRDGEEFYVQIPYDKQYNTKERETDFKCTWQDLEGVPIEDTIEAGKIPHVGKAATKLKKKVVKDISEARVKCVSRQKWQVLGRVPSNWLHDFAEFGAGPDDLAFITGLVNELPGYIEYHCDDAHQYYSVSLHGQPVEVSLMEGRFRWLTCVAMRGLERNTIRAVFLSQGHKDREKLVLLAIFPYDRDYISFLNYLSTVRRLVEDTDVPIEINPNVEDLLVHQMDNVLPPPFLPKVPKVECNINAADYEFKILTFGVKKTDVEVSSHRSMLKLKILQESKDGRIMRAGHEVNVPLEGEVLVHKFVTYMKKGFLHVIVPRVKDRRR